MPISTPTMMRPRRDFPTPLFKITVPLLVVALAALVVYLALA
jgi:hypothetical protein